MKGIGSAWIQRAARGAFLLVSIILFPLFAAGKHTDTFAPKQVPKWLDTIPPTVEILPEKTYHSSLFMIVLSANKRSRFWIGINSAEKMVEYLSPITIAQDTVMTVYYYGEDDFGNKSSVDSMRYVLDSRPPKLRLIPDPGSYAKGVVVYFAADELCRFEYLKDPSLSSGKAVPESVSVTGVFEGYIAAIDSAGNRTVSDLLKYVVDTSTVQVSVQPEGGLFKAQPAITFDASKGAKIYYSFDPLSPPDLFKEYTGTVRLPHGLSVLRYFGKNQHGRSSVIQKAKFILDTIPPKIHLQAVDGTSSDMVSLSVKERASIRYTLDGSVPNAKSALYAKPITVPHKGRAALKALAWDEAGNQSELLEWEKKYDFNPPIVIMTPNGGVFTKPFTASIATDEKTDIFYTLDGSDPDETSLLYSSEGIAISREGATTVRYFAVDEAGNRSEERSATFLLDTKPPQVKVRIVGSLLLKNFQVRLIANEPAKIFYEIDGSKPTFQSPLYTAPIPLQSGQTVAYMAIDSAGNRSTIYLMDELKKPMVSPKPAAGMYNHRVTVTFVTNIAGIVYYRMLPDTTFRQFRDSVSLKNEGVHSIEYYLESQDGLKSPLRRSEYYIDWTPPRVGISIKKGLGDSVSLFFECSENATVYYTTDGSNPLFSPKTNTAGNKFTMARDRIGLLRSSEAKLAFYAEDAAGNQSALTVMDVFKPRVIPNVPAGADKLYDRILSVTLNTYDQSTVYYCRHGRMPTTDSSVFAEPVTLITSDTLVAFAIDASGFRGEPDTFVYLIDLPPSPHFNITPDTVMTGTEAVFDASTSVDKESPLSHLSFRWDFAGDDTFDTDTTHQSRVSYTYRKPGLYKPRLEVIDVNGRSSILERQLHVYERCPTGMVSVTDASGHSFCIDRYEWPNRADEVPRVGVSWVEAKVACIDAGKRLCTRQEWEAVCHSGTSTAYPYGDRYDKKRCRTEEKSAGKSGTNRRCGGSGAFDMLGNIWEWVEDKQGDYPVMMGGSYHDGRDAHCALSALGTIGTRNKDTGFRCCK